ncbi:MAG: sigma-70 family RNA polymerase sigma factor [Lysinibacillus sp.]
MSEQLQQAMNEYGEYCLRMAYLYTKDWALAEEIVQDSFLAYYMQQNFQQQSSLKTYLTKIVIYKSKNALRFKWAKKRQPVYIELDQAPSNEHTYLKKEQQQMLVTALLQIPLKYREPLILHYYQQFSIREIANILNTSENTVKTRMRRGREKLKPLLLEEVFFDDEN